MKRSLKTTPMRNSDQARGVRTIRKGLLQPGRLLARLWLLLSLVFVPCSASAQIVFISQNPLKVGLNPSAVAVGDFNGDGKADLIVANHGSASLSSLRGIGDGLFFALQDQPVGVGPAAVVAGDFNQDGILDLAVANSVSNTISILQGFGAATFRQVANLVSSSPSYLVVADFNGDGRQDLAVAEAGSNQVSLFRGLGSGQFQQYLKVTVGERPTCLIVGDFNADGKPDLAVANRNSASVSLLLGIGNGYFQAVRNFDAGPLPVFIATGDFDDDGIPDLVVANGTSAQTGHVSVLLGLTGGYFQSPRSFPAGSNPSAVQVADFDLDGRLDLAVANANSNTISILLSIGNGYFQRPQDFATGLAPQWVSPVDLNADGKPDLVVANNQSGTVSVLMNRTSTKRQPGVSSIQNAATRRAGPIAPGELVVISGSNLGPNATVGPEFSSAGHLSTMLGQTQVLFDGMPSALISASAGQVTAIVPYIVGGRSNTQLVVVKDGVMSPTLTVQVAASSPGLFTQSVTGIGQGAILNNDGSPNSSTNPAPKGSTVVLYATGAGQTTSAGSDGLVASDVLPRPVLPVSVTIDGQAAHVFYAGAAPGQVAGVMQVNVEVPAGTRSGDVPVVLRVGSASSPPVVTLAVQ